MKLFEITQTSETQPQSANAVVVEWMKKQRIGVKRYKINPNGSVDITGDFNISNITDNKLPFVVNSVSGTVAYQTHTPTLTTLEGFPTEVGGDLTIWNCTNIDLTHLPHKVGGQMYISQLNETFENAVIDYCGDAAISNYTASTLKGMPKYVEKDCSLSSCNLDNLTGAPPHVGGMFHISGGKVKSLDGLSTYVGGGLMIWHGGFPEELGTMGTIHGDISMQCNNLKDLTGLPSHVTGNLQLEGVKSLTGFPSKIDGCVNIYLEDNVSTSNLHKRFEMKGRLTLNNPVGRALLSIPKIRGITSVQFTGYTGDTNIKKLEAVINSCIGNDIDIHEMQDRLIDSGFYKEARL